MGYLLHIFAAFGVHALAEDFPLPLRLPIELGLFLLVLPWALAGLSRLAALRGHFRWAEMIGRVLGGFGPLGLAFLCGLCGWLESIEAWLGEPTLARPNLALLASLSPFVVFQVVGIDAQARARASHPQQLRRVRAFQWRMFASSLAPVGVYFALTFAVNRSEVVRVHVERVALFQALFLGVLLGLLTLLLPRLLAATWETVAFPEGPERSLLAAVAQRAGFRTRKLLIWRTGHSMANAAIVGLFPSTRIVLFSDSLLSLLGPRELAAVYGHEIGHAMCRHVTIFLCWALAFFLGGDLLATWLAPGDLWVQTGIVVVAVALWMLVFGWLSRRFELEADLYSLELLGDPSGLIAALERLGGRLRDVAGWRHFSVSDRVQFLERAWAEQGFSRRFRGRLAWLARSGIALAVLALAGQAWSLWSRFPEDRMYAELGLGRYAAAAELARTSQLDPEWVEVSELGAALAPEATRVPEALVEERYEELLAGLEDLESATRLVPYAQLLFLRGNDDLIDLVRRLEDWIDDSDDPRSAADWSELRERFSPAAPQ